MRFLNTGTLKFEQIPDSELHLEKNQYAILSHRWGAVEDEISYEDVLLRKDFSDKKGSDKIKGFCEVASLRNCRYGWVDTCCIDKQNSNELEEAINSMYLWYQGSEICITYLQDVPQTQLTDSNWFDRGWTLQELIGPKAVAFFDHDWNAIGTKAELITDLSRKTSIPEGILSHGIEPSACSVAQRMSWAANRTTTRVEDRAYSLMGLFDVNMPMIYGEREKAFLRLQQHIIQRSKDESIFAWRMEFPGYTRAYSGLFAPSPKVYASCSDIIQTQGSHGFSEINGELLMRTKISNHGPKTYFAQLNCTDKAYPDGKASILIAKTSTEGEYVRVRDANTGSLSFTQSDHETRFQELQIRVVVNPTNPPVEIYNGVWLRTLQPPGHNNCQTTILSNCQTSEKDHMCQHEYNQGVAGIVHIEPRSYETSTWSKIRWITFSFDEDLNPVLWLANDKYSDRLQNFQQAVASGNKSLQHQQLMYNCKMDTFGAGQRYRWPTYSEFPRISDDPNLWPNGELVMTVDSEKSIYRRVIEPLNLEISVQLQPRQSPTTTVTGNTDGSGLLLKPMDIWTVDIIDTGGKSPEERTIERNIQARERQERRKGVQRRKRRYDNRLALCSIIFVLGLVIGSAAFISHFKH